MGMALLLALALVEPSGEWVYVRHPPTIYVALLEGKPHYGTANEAGEFVPSEVFRPRAGGDPTRRWGAVRWKGSTPMEPVYQYRQGRLVPGFLDQEQFIPEVGGIVIGVEEHVKKPGSRRIYNLPGRFMPRAEYEELKKSGQVRRDE